MAGGRGLEVRLLVVLRRAGEREGIPCLRVMNWLSSGILYLPPGRVCVLQLLYVEGKSVDSSP